MKKEFYIGQPLIIKKTGEKVTFAYDNGEDETPCIVLHVDNYFSHQYCEYGELELSTEFRFSEIIAGLEQRYFEIGTEFQTEYQTFVVRETLVGLGLREKEGDLIDVNIHAGSINSIWQLVEERKEMTLEEIEAELGYKIKLKDNI